VCLVLLLLFFFLCQPEALTDAQFYWLLQDLGLGLSSDEVAVLCRRAPAADGKIDWARFAPR
jgi:hypothetical protein